MRKQGKKIQAARHYITTQDYAKKVKKWNDVFARYFADRIMKGRI